MKTGSKNDILTAILKHRGITSKKALQEFLFPTHPDRLSLHELEIDSKNLKRAVQRIIKAIKTKESIVVYTDYDADGLTAGAIVWETIYKLKGNIMPYVPHRVEEGYGLTQKGIDAVIAMFHPTLLITVDHGITSRKEIQYAKSKGVETIVCDHHVKPKNLPDALIVHTTKLSGAGVAYFLAKNLISSFDKRQTGNYGLLSLSAIGTIADMMPLMGPNRSIAKFGLEELKKTHRVGLLALMEEAGIQKSQVTAYNISHMIAPRLNAMGRMEHAIDGLRLLCTNNRDKATLLAHRLGLTNRERQQLTVDTTLHAKAYVEKEHGKTVKKKLLFVAHETYSQGIIGLVAGKLVETYYLPSVVISKGEKISKASARSISGFNIVEAIRSLSNLLIDVGGHPQAAGFTIETGKLSKFQKQLEKLAEEEITDSMLKRPVIIDLTLPFERVTEDLCEQIQLLQPFGFGNPEPVFLSKGVKVIDFRRLGADRKHLKLRLAKQLNKHSLEAIFFNHGSLSDTLKQGQPVDIVYTIDRNEWNGTRSVQLKLKDIRIPS